MMMMDRLDALEERIAALVDKINEAKSRILDLQRQNRELTAIAEQKQITDQQNAALQERIRELEAELNGRDDKDSIIRDRIKVILNRVDTLESELAGLDDN